MIAIVDYGMGNLRSVEKALQFLGHPAQITSHPPDLAKAASVVLPGVGHFGKAAESLRRSGMERELRAAIEAGKPFLGICLGLQLLFEESEEAPGVPGLGLLAGRVVRFQVDGDLKVPHMGWNSVRQARPCPLLKEVPDGAMAYFVHSYYGAPADPQAVAATTEHGAPFASMVQRGSIFACQFHPEKSGKVGLTMLENFARL